MSNALVSFAHYYHKYSHIETITAIISKSNMLRNHKIQDNCGNFTVFEISFKKQLLMAVVGPSRMQLDVVSLLKAEVYGNYGKEAYLF